MAELLLQTPFDLSSQGLCPVTDHFVLLAAFISCVDPGAIGLPVLFGSFGKKRYGSTSHTCSVDEAYECRFHCVGTHGAERDFTGLPTAPHTLLSRGSEQSRDLLRAAGPLGGIARARAGCQAPHPAPLPLQLRGQPPDAETTRHLQGKSTSQTVLP